VDRPHVGAWRLEVLDRGAMAYGLGLEESQDVGREDGMGTN
jgi:hypothetical protein